MSEADFPLAIKFLNLMNVLEIDETMEIYAPHIEAHRVYDDEIVVLGFFDKSAVILGENDEIYATECTCPSCVANFWGDMMEQYPQIKADMPDSLKGLIDRVKARDHVDMGSLLGSVLQALKKGGILQ